MMKKIVKEIKYILKIKYLERTQTKKKKNKHYYLIINFIGLKNNK